MAKARPNLIQKTKRPKPVARSVVKSIDDKYYGPEPIDISIKGYGEALNWYNYMFESDQAREWLLEYMKKHNTKQELQAVKSLPKYAIPTTMGWIARMLMNGNQIDTPYFQQRMKELIEEGSTTKPKQTEKSDEKVVSIQERTLAKSQQLFAECEVDVVDNRGSMYEFLNSKQATPAAATYIRSQYTKICEEIMSDDPDVKEAYGKKLKTERQFWQNIIADLDRYLGNKKVAKVRKPRQKKQKSAVELIKSLKYQKEFPPLKIVSVNPAEVIGAQQLWTYNTKTKKLSKYDATGPSGIQVKGTTLTGFDVEHSSAKTLRKPDGTIQSLLGAGKVALRKFMDELKTLETKPNGRINTDTILLRVVK